MYKRQLYDALPDAAGRGADWRQMQAYSLLWPRGVDVRERCLLYTSDAADERSSVDLGGRRIIKKKTRDMPSYGAGTCISID